MPEPLISARGLNRHYGAVQALVDVDLDVHAGEVVSIIGPSGSGKSTLIRCLNGLEIPTSGTITIDGQPIGLRDHRAWTRIRPDVGMVFQDYTLFPHLTVLRNMTLAPVRRGRASRAEAEANAMELLAKVGLADKAHVHPAELSGGQQQRVAIVRALAMKPKVLLFDEPTSALDPETIRDVLEVMQQLAREGMTMVVVTHEIGFAGEVGSRLVFMERGRIVEEGPPRQLLERPASRRLADFLAHLIRH
ncbi:MAG TPA: amino acid ABC transporter ATP-binding protein [Geminicoccus sp.]|uniref:amino acid ABC transporter ATP-binding protein n=1 Tax=Geminicoccus sp. TaxID=2024832 RepID=UPI002D167D20|nr:amino acid ABC transporter ATP-binding protein [Geminicoccus sp.]HWL72079.1 amino acid ABC transporter ATP-binding protein [Geminicoccus sp.]